ncbi:NAD-dependent epimerase/dehydratase family protein [Sphingomonas sp. FW199]|uniref:NAD-dependent epimerase/dehydratase family protein n=1 Tax=Sphingomonas sp. FW199 TaxID=3400217 RepID=UPI003CFB55C6
MKTAAITGVTGVAGSHVAAALTVRGFRVVGISRGGREGNGALRIVPDLSDAAALEPALKGCDIVFHFADRADRKSYTEADVNTAATVITAIRNAAVRCGITRIVAASSVYAESASAGALYGRSKRAMEVAATAPGFGEPAIVLRLPPLYGPGARGAVRHIARVAERGWPLPFGLALAPRRFLSLDSLADLCAHLTALDEGTFSRATGRILVPSMNRVDSLYTLANSLASGCSRLLPVPMIDRLLAGGRVEASQLARDREAVHSAIGWRSPD